MHYAMSLVNVPVGSRIGGLVVTVYFVLCGGGAQGILVMTSQLATVGQTFPRKHVRGNVRYLVKWNIKQFTVGYFPRLDNFFF
jgi:hypothetical protein